ncbi:sigma-70 family RNA polymerase sigma factor [Streptomyces sp. YS415]|uniref:sigma-70 family RNA polymerase sigma factor n=1 Tax=Streptomyces sp. YS415 TaxID=2944806 RepID=UPI00202298D4|nr:sigma-70 family RNA polymerase sigma factor [Streptomyces sp. YS415]MCL7429403.1 sigma-70 family RNA polymerase sigma factor [Streptomyces sp. YS415]
MRLADGSAPGTGTVGTADECGEFIRSLYAQHGSLLLRYAVRLLGGDWHRAEDVLQEAAVRAWRHASVLGLKVEEARPWMFTVVRNLVTDHHRARLIRPPEVSTQLLDMPVEDGLDGLLTRRAVTEALEELSEQHREVIQLMYYLECSVAQAAEHLGIPPGTVKSRSYYALRALRKVLAERGITG